MGASPTVRGRRPLRAWLPVLGWIALIFVFSGGSFSAQTTKPLLLTVVRYFHPDITEAQAAALHRTFRKSAHVGEYAVLGALAFRAFHPPSPPARAAALGFALVVAVASADETRQALLPNRTGSAADVALDAVGGALGLGLAAAWARGMRRSRPGPLP